MTKTNARKLYVDFMALRFSVQIAIAKKLDLYDSADLNLTQFFLMRKILDRAIEKDVLDALREEVDNAER